MMNEQTECIILSGTDANHLCGQDPLIDGALFYLCLAGFDKLQVGIVTSLQTGVPSQSRRLGYMVLNMPYEEQQRKNKKGQDIYALIQLCNEQPPLVDGKRLANRSWRPRYASRKKEDIIGVRAWFLDWDRAQEPPPQFPITPHMTVESSPGKFHFYWRCDCSVDQWKDVQPALVEQYGGDPNCVDLSRVLRVPGFVNHKYGTEVRLKECRFDKSMNAKEFTKGMELGKVKRRRRKKSAYWIYEGDIKESLPKVKMYLNEIVTVGRRDWFLLLCAVKNEVGDAGYELARKFTEERAIEQTTDLVKEFEKTWQSIDQGRENGCGMGTLYYLWEKCHDFKDAKRMC